MWSHCLHSPLPMNPEKILHILLTLGFTTLVRTSHRSNEFLYVMSLLVGGAIRFMAKQWSICHLWSSSFIEKYAQIKHCLRVKTVNKYVSVFWCKRTKGDGLFHWRKRYYGLVLWICFLQTQDVNWWTGVVWITVGLLWCFYQLFRLILTAPIHCRGSIFEKVM